MKYQEKIKVGEGQRTIKRFVNRTMPGASKALKQPSQRTIKSFARSKELEPKRVVKSTGAVKSIALSNRLDKGRRGVE